jgi:cytochrome c553
MQQDNRREYKNQKAPRLAGLLAKYLYKSITYRLYGGGPSHQPYCLSIPPCLQGNLQGI